MLGKEIGRKKKAEIGKEERGGEIKEEKRRGILVLLDFWLEKNGKISWSQDC